MTVGTKHAQGVHNNSNSNSNMLQYSTKWGAMSPTSPHPTKGNLHVLKKMFFMPIWIKPLQGLSTDFK